MLYNVENEIVDQKNRILSLVNDENIEAAVTLLSFVEPLWNKVGYAYKASEIRQRIRDVARHNEVVATH